MSATVSSEPFCAATSTKPNNFCGHLVTSFAAAAQARPSPATLSAATRPQPSLQITTGKSRCPSFCGQGLFHRSDTLCDSPVTSFAAAVSDSAPPSPRCLIGNHIPHSQPYSFVCRGDDHSGRPVAASEVLAHAPSFRRGLIRDGMYAT